MTTMSDPSKKSTPEKLWLGQKSRTLKMTLWGSLFIVLLSLVTPIPFTQEDGLVEVGQVILLAITSLVAFIGFALHIFGSKGKGRSSLQPCQNESIRDFLAGMSAVTASMALREVSSCGSDYAKIMCLPKEMKYGLILTILLGYLLFMLFPKNRIRNTLARFKHPDTIWIYPFTAVTVVASFGFEQILYARGEELFELVLYGVFLMLAVRLTLKSEYFCSRAVGVSNLTTAEK